MNKEQYLQFYNALVSAETSRALRYAHRGHGKTWRRHNAFRPVEARGAFDQQKNGKNPTPFCN